MEKSKLNPQAPVYIPSSLQKPFGFPFGAPFAYYPSFQQQPHVFYFHFLTPSKPLTAPYFPKTHLFNPPASPTSTLQLIEQSPLTNPDPVPAPFKTRKSFTGRTLISRRFTSSNSQSKWVIRKHPQAVQKQNPQFSQVDCTNTPLASYPFGDCTSLMIRNIPARLSRRELIELLDDHCRLENEKLSITSLASEFDFVYLPFDFRKKGNLGYAFVNFTNWEGASRLYNAWKGLMKWENCGYGTQKICHIDPAKFQGNELKNHFDKSVFQCETDEFLPVMIRPPKNGSNSELTRVMTVGNRVVPLRMRN